MAKEGIPIANFVYTNAKRALLAGEIDLDTAGNEIRVIYVMTNTTADTEEDVATVGAITTLDELDGAGYTSGGQQLDSQAVAADNVNNRGEFDAADEVFLSIGVGTRQVQAALIIKWVTNLASSIPIAFIDTGGFPFDPNGGDITNVWNAEGILQAT